MSKMKENAFAVVLTGKTTSTTDYYLAVLVEKCQKAGLTVTGIDTPPYVKRGIEHATTGHVLTVGGSKTHDVDWIERAAYACEKGYNPIFTDIVGQWKDINNQLDAYIESNAKTYIDFNGSKREIEVYDNFVIVRGRNAYEDDLKLSRKTVKQMYIHSL